MKDKQNSKYILSRKTLIEYIYKENKPVSKKNIEIFFGSNKSKSIEKLLFTLIKEGMIIKFKKNFYQSSLPINKKILLEITQINNDKFFSYPLKIRRKNNRIKPIFSSSDDKKTLKNIEIGQKFYGKIILDQNQNFLVKFLEYQKIQINDYIYGLVHFKKDKFYLQHDDIKRKFIEITSCNNKLSLKQGQIVKVFLIRQGTRNIKAKVSEIIGNINSARDLSNYLVIKNNLSLDFSKEIEKEAENLNKINFNTKDRKDLRNLDFITIDPSDAMDHDDAIWASEDSGTYNENGWNIKIAIADVSFYVKEKTLIDLEALKRSFSIYFPDKVIPMLPFNLSNNLCSLNKNKDRPAIVVDIKINPQGQILSYDFFPAIVNISANLNYEEFNKFIEKKQISKAYMPLKKTIHNIIGSYNSLKKIMQTREPLTITSQEIRISLKNDTIDKINSYKTLESHKLVEEFMITANLCAANFIIKNKIKSLYRVHEKPSLSKIYDLKKSLDDLNIKFFMDESINTTYLNNLLSQNKGNKNFDLINLLILRCQSQANYSQNNIGHFGLSLKAYTHFTSPIRRYADLLVHRSIIANRNTNSSNNLNNIIPLQISKIERSNMQIERNMQSIYSALFFSKKIGENFEAYITSIKKFGLFVSLKGINIEGLIHKKNLGKDSFFFDFTKNSLIGKKNKETFKVGDYIKVKLIDINILLGELSFQRVL